jgi:hypothetical protein
MAHLSEPSASRVATRIVTQNAMVSRESPGSTSCVKVTVGSAVRIADGAAAHTCSGAQSK